MIAQFGISQADYPKLRLIDQDTVVIFNMPQLKKLNASFLDLDRYKALLINLNSEIKLLNQKDSVYDLSEKEFKYQILNLKKQKKESNSQMLILKDQNTAQAEQIKALKKTRTVWVVIGALGYLGITKLSP
jgi:hypothetical protein